MAKDFAKAFYKSAAWIKCRESFIKERQAIDGGMCMKCHRNPGYIVHHKIYLSPENITDGSISLNHQNLLYWCKSCHDAEHFGFKDTGLLCLFDERGFPIASAERNED